MGKIRGVTKYNEKIDPVMFVSADYAQKTVKSNAENEKSTLF